MLQNASVKLTLLSLYENTFVLFINNIFSKKIYVSC